MKCPARNQIINNQLCELFYPYGCGTKCRNLYKKWIKENEEVRKLEEIKESEKNE